MSEESTDKQSKETGKGAEKTGPSGCRAVLFRLIMATVMCGLFWLIADRVLLWSGMPTSPQRISHPANHTETRKNIEFEYEFKTNSEGLRYADIPLEKQSKNEFRAVVVGDSFAEGLGVEANETYEAALESHFSSKSRPAHFINAGLTGTGPVEYGRILFLVGMKYRPDLVVFTLYGNDLNSIPEHQTKLDVVRGDDGTFTLLQKQPPPPTGVIRSVFNGLFPWTYASLHSAMRMSEGKRMLEMSVREQVVEASQWEEDLSEEQANACVDGIPAELVEAADDGLFEPTYLIAGCLWPDDYRELLDVHGPRAEKRWKNMRSILSQVVEYTRAEKVPAAFVYIPVPLQHDPTIWPYFKQMRTVLRPEWISEEAEIERRLKAWARHTKVPFLSLTETFRKASKEHPGRYNHKLDGHWNAEGHKLGGDTMAAWLREQGLVPDE